MFVNDLQNYALNKYKNPLITFLKLTISLQVHEYTAER